jgi:pimeloyl-ACP methyl ester carboxylesterase
MLKPQDKFTTINDLTLHYLDWGNPDTLPMVLLHGLYGNAHYWDFFASNMSNQYHILALDQRGHGDSTWAGNYGPRDYVSDLEAFVVKLDLKEITLIGHSLGGINSILYAALHPDHIAKLVIIDIGPEIASAGAERMLKEMLNEPDSFASLEEAASYIMQIQPSYSDIFLRHQLKHALKQDNSGKFTFKFDTALRDTNMRSPEWLWEYLELVVCPALILHGSDSDILLDNIAHRMCNCLPFGSITDISPAGHSIPGDNPQEFETAVRHFLEQ